MLLMVINGVLTGGLQGMERMRSVALADALSKSLLLVLVAVFLFQGYGVFGVAAAYIISDVFSIAWQFVALRRSGGLSGPIEFKVWRSLVVGGAPFLIWEAALLTYARVDVLILAFFAHDAVLGWYHAAYRLISIPLFVPAVLMTAVFPALSATAKDHAVFNTIARRAVHIAALTTIPMSLGLIVLADQIIVLLGYPEGFQNSVVPIMALAVSLPLVALNMIVGSALNAQDRQRQWALTGVAAAVLNPTLNLIAIPYTQATFGNGAIGAAMVTSLTEVFMFVVGQFLLPRGVLNTATAVGVLKCVAVGLVMAAAVWLGRGLPVLVTISLGAMVYAAGSLLLGTVTLHDLSRVRTHLASRRAPATVAA
jgi:O-antigen/teichoic acid export membrane protein